MKLTAGEVSRLVGIHVETVRALEKRGVIQSQRDLNNWRRFSPDVVDKLKRLYAGAGEILQSEAGAVYTHPDAPVEAR